MGKIDGILSGSKGPSKGQKAEPVSRGWEDGHQPTCLHPVMVKLAPLCFPLSKGTIQCMSLVLESRSGSPRTGIVLIQLVSQHPPTGGLAYL